MIAPKIEFTERTTASGGERHYPPVRINLSSAPKEEEYVIPFASWDIPQEDLVSTTIRPWDTLPHTVAYNPAR